MTTRYPQGYGTFVATIDSVRAAHRDRPGRTPHPEFWRRLEAALTWNNSQPGRVLLGIGGGWRPNPSDTSAASRAGRSFHQDQRFRSGFFGYSAVDLVAQNRVGPNVYDRHRSPTWAEVEFFKLFGLHAFITKPQEPWHIQCVEMRGYWTWLATGRRDPKAGYKFDQTVVFAPPTTGGSVVDSALQNIDTVSTNTIGPHADVQRAQVLLNLFLANSPAHDWAVQVDGFFRDSTRTATLAFQKATGLPEDGVIGPATWRRLLGAHA